MILMKKKIVIVSTGIVICLAAPAILYVGGLFIAHEGNPDFLKIDACLDAGGAWDYTNRTCIFSVQPPSKP